MPAKVTVTGIRAIDRRLVDLDRKLARKFIRRGMRDGLKVVKAAVVAEAPRRTGFMAKQVKVRAVRKRKRGTIRLQVIIPGKLFYARFPNKVPKGKGSRSTPYYPAIVEFGLPSRHRPADPFAKRALKRTEAAARAKFEASIRAALRSVGR